MDKKIIITIAREFGSGGRYIGRQLAEAMNISFYDKELIQLAAKDSGIDSALFEDADEGPSNVFWTAPTGAPAFGNQFTSRSEIPMKDKLFFIQSNIIRKIAAEDSCVIVGRCADYLLKEEEQAIHLFIYSDREDKMQRMAEHYGIPQSQAQSVMTKTDKKRSSYYLYYTGRKWGDLANYDLALKSSTVGIEGAVRVIQEFVAQKRP